MKTFRAIILHSGIQREIEVRSLDLFTAVAKIRLQYCHVTIKLLEEKR